MADRPRQSGAQGQARAQVSSVPSRHLSALQCAAPERAHAPALLVVDPRAIERCFIRDGLWSKLRFIPNRLGLPACIRRGGWDLRSRPFAQQPTCAMLRSFEAHRHNADILRHALGRDFPKRRGDRPRTVQDPRFPGYVARCGELASSLQRRGYVPELAADHIGLAIGRDGEVIKVADGTHRLALAQRLGLTRVVGELRFVHSAWYGRHVGRETADAGARIAAALHEAGYRLRDPAPPAVAPEPARGCERVAPVRSW